MSCILGAIGLTFFISCIFSVCAHFKESQSLKSPIVIFDNNDLPGQLNDIISQAADSLYEKSIEPDTLFVVYGKAYNAEESKDPINGINMISSHGDALRDTLFIEPEAAPVGLVKPTYDTKGLIAKKIKELIDG